MRPSKQAALLLLVTLPSVTACVSSNGSPTPEADGSFDFDASGVDVTGFDATGLDVTGIDSAPSRDSGVAADSATSGDSRAPLDSGAPDSTTNPPPDAGQDATLADAEGGFDATLPDAGPDSSAPEDAGEDAATVDSSVAVDAADAAVDAGPGIVTSNPGLHLSTFRQGHNATLLVDGRVLFCGGYYGPSGSQSSCDLFDPTTTSMSPGPSMNVGRQGHSATLLPNGQVLIAGGSGPLADGGFNTLQSAEIFDPTGPSFTLVTSSMVQARSSAAVLLTSAPNAGSVLLIGGYGDGTIDSGTPNDFSLGSTEVFYPRRCRRPRDLHVERAALGSARLVDRRPAPRRGSPRRGGELWPRRRALHVPRHGRDDRPHA